MSRRRPSRPKTVHRIRKHGVGKLVRVLSEETKDRVKLYRLQVADGYETRRYRFERVVFYGMAAGMNHYLAKRPHIDFKHKRNLAKKTLYRLPSFARWAALMEGQGSLAMEPLHNPELKRLASGGRLGPVTRRLFRHGSDPVGIRSRTVTAGWLAQAYARSHDGQQVTWLSLAGGSAAHAIVMMHASGIDMQRLHYVNIDINPQAIELATVATELAGLRREHVRLAVGDVFDERLLDEAGANSGVDIIDMMGIMEYLDDERATLLLQQAYNRLKPDGIILTCNMRESHPQLALHKRGVGWPGVVPRSTEQFIELCLRSGASPENISVYQPGDGVYNVVRISK